MLQDSQVGAVAGNVKVFNRGRCLMARMLAVRFVLAFDFLQGLPKHVRLRHLHPGRPVRLPGARP